MREHGLGRKPSPPDDRDLKMKDAVRFLEAGHIKPNQWVDYAVLDQGQTPHCVGFGSSGLLASTPVPVSGITNKTADALYYACKKKDGEPGAEDGSTVRTAAKVLKDQKRIGAYFFADSVDEAAAYVSVHGPVVLGIDWYNSMFTPDPNGIVKPTGGIAGGHCVLWYGVDANYATIRNSWGPTWGTRGDCRILLTDLSNIFKDNGEALAATETAVAPKKGSCLTRLFHKVVNGS